MGELSGDTSQLRGRCPRYLMQAQIPLTAPPPNLVIASKSSPWATIWRMLGVVLLTYIIANAITLIAFGLWTLDPFLIIGASIFTLPLILLFIRIRRPRLTHILAANPEIDGVSFHDIPDGRRISTPVPTRFAHHLVKDSPPLELPPSQTLWAVFFVTLFISVSAFLPMLLIDHPYAILLAVIVALPAWLIGFSIPVHAWWSFSMEYLELDTNRWQAEMMLIAGMLSTIPAIIHNSLLFPEFLAFVGIDSFDPYSIGELLILAVSAPVGEEIFKALFVLSLYRIIDSPRRGFQVGFSVGLGFAMLENLQYILASLFGGEYAAITYGMTTLVRGIGSIPGHAFWTGISGCAIGWHLSQRDGGENHSLNTEATNWMLIDAHSGQALPNREQKERGVIQRWLDIPSDKAWHLPKSPILALAWAISAHSLWNGSSWFVSYVFRNSDGLTNLLATIIWTSFLISMLWFVGRHILASVKHLPDGKDVRQG